MDDYSKMTYGMRDTLQLIGEDDNDVMFRSAAAGAGVVLPYTRMVCTNCLTK